MISTIKNSEGYVVAYAEWRLLNSLGFPFHPKEYIFIKDLWIHPKYRGKALRNIIYEIDNNPISKKAKYIFWNNEKHKRLSKTFNKLRLSKKGVRKC